MATTIRWYPLHSVGNYFAEEAGVILACPMNLNGSRASDEEVCECADQAEARVFYDLAREARRTPQRKPAIERMARGLEACPSDCSCESE